MHHTNPYGTSLFMYSWKTSLHLDAPRDKVWSTLIDFANASAWKPGVKSGTVETDGPVGQGTRVREERNGKVTTLTVEEWGPPRLLRLYLTRGGTNGSSRYSLSNAPNGGTQLDHNFELDPPFFLQPLMLFVGIGLKKEFAALKSFVERRD